MLEYWISYWGPLLRGENRVIILRPLPRTLLSSERPMVLKELSEGKGILLTKTFI